MQISFTQFLQKIYPQYCSTVSKVSHFSWFRKNVFRSYEHFFRVWSKKNSIFERQSNNDEKRWCMEDTNTQVSIYIRHSRVTLKRWPSFLISLTKYLFSSVTRLLMRHSVSLKLHFAKAYDWLMDTSSLSSPLKMITPTWSKCKCIFIT